MKYNPDDVTERAEAKEGTFYFVVIKAENGYAQTSGNEMITLELETHIDNSVLIIFDRLVNVPQSLFKVKQFAIAVGKENIFHSGTFTADNCQGASGIAEFRFGEEKENSLVPFPLPPLTFSTGRL